VIESPADGGDSGFESATTLYYLSIEVTLDPK
jgi:hypothetical protein